MGRTLLVATIVLGISLASSAEALARPPQDAPPAWDQVILCIEGSHALSHPVFRWGNVQCVPDTP